VGLKIHGPVLVAIGLIEDLVCCCVGRSQTARGVGLTDRKEAIAPTFLCIQHLLFGDVAVHAHRLAVGQCSTGSRSQQGQHQSAEGGGQTKVHDDSGSQRPWNYTGLNHRFAWPCLPYVVSKKSHQAALVLYLEVGLAIGTAIDRSQYHVAEAK